MTGDAYRQPRVAGEGVTGKGDEAPPDSKTPARGFPRRRDGPEPLAAAQSIFGSVSNWWYGGGLGSVHSSVVAPSPHGLSAAFLPAASDKIRLMKKTTMPTDRKSTRLNSSH